MTDFRLLVERARRAVCVVDDAWVVTYANPAFTLLFEAHAGCSLLDVVDPAHHGLVERSATDLAGEPLEFRLLDGARWVEADLSWLPDAGLVLELRGSAEVPEADALDGEPAAQRPLAHAEVAGDRTEPGAMISCGAATF